MLPTTTTRAPGEASRNASASLSISVTSTSWYCAITAYSSSGALSPKPLSQPTGWSVPARCNSPFSSRAPSSTRSPTRWSAQAMPSLVPAPHAATIRTNSTGRRCCVNSSTLPHKQPPSIFILPLLLPEALPPSKPERLLCRPCRLDVNALQREHADLGRRAAWRGKTTNLTARRQDSVAGDHQRHRILRHGLADIARGFRSGAEFLR